MVGERFVLHIKINGKNNVYRKSQTVDSKCKNYKKKQMSYLVTILVAILFIIAYGLGLFYWNKKVNYRLNPKISRGIKLLHYTGLLICITIAITYINFGIGLRGLWTTRTIIIFTLLTGIFFIFLADKSSIKKVEKRYFKTFSFLPILTAGTLFIPFIGVVIILSLFGLLTYPATEIYYEDDILRVQSSFVGVLGQPKFDIFEKKLKHAEYWTNEIDSLKVSYDSDSTRIIIYRLYDNDEMRKEETETICLRRLK